MTSGTFENSAIILVAHGERGGARRNTAFLSHAEAIKARLGCGAVQACLLNGEPAADRIFAEAAAGGFDRILVYPLFMSDGYFVDQVLPSRIEEAGLTAITTILPPLGFDPKLPAIFLEHILQTAAGAGIAPRKSILIVVGHGSKFGRASALSTERMAETLRETGDFMQVRTAFLEEAPFLRQVLEAGNGPAIVAGFFAGDGMHAHEDVPLAIDETGANAVYTGPIGVLPEIADLMANALENCLRKNDKR